MDATPAAPFQPPPGDDARLEALRRYRILDSLAEQAYDDVVKVASTLCGTSQAVVSFIDETRQWFKASIGVDDEETPRDIAFCDVAIRKPDAVLVVNDASSHPIFRSYPQVTGPDHLRFYAGAPLVTPDGFALGTVCVFDSVPHQLEPAQVEALQALSRMVVRLLELRRAELEGRRELVERELTTQSLLRYQRELEAQKTELEEEARRDALTGLLNRSGLQRATELGWAGTGPFSVAVLDLDHFKRVNDTLGHSAGDEVIRIAAEEISRGVRGDDVAARYGGEEFLLMMPATPLAAAVGVVERIREAIAARSDLPTPVTLSAGVAAGVAGRDAPEQVFRAADQALYLAKRRGRNRVEIAPE